MLTKNLDTVGLKARAAAQPESPPVGWAGSLAQFDTALRTQGMAERTRRAYGVDLGQLAEWASGNGLGPAQLDYRTLRRFAGVLSERGASKSTVARKLAAIRAFYRVMVQRGVLESSPADLVASPKADSYLPGVLKAREAADLLGAMPVSAPLDTRDRAIFELAYSAGLRAEELVNLDVADLDPLTEEARAASRCLADLPTVAGLEPVATVAHRVAEARSGAEAIHALVSFHHQEGRRWIDVAGGDRYVLGAHGAFVSPASSFHGYTLPSAMRVYRDTAEVLG